MPPGRRLELPGPDRVPAVGQLFGLARRCVQPEQLAVNPHVHDREDRIPVDRPGRVAELVGQVGSQDPGLAPAGRGQEDVAVVVLLEPLVRARQKQHPGAVGRHLRPRLRHVVGGQPAGVASIGSHHPDLARVAILEHRIRSAMQGDPLAVAREVVVDDGVGRLRSPARLRPSTPSPSRDDGAGSSLRRRRRRPSLPRGPAAPPASRRRRENR